MNVIAQSIARIGINYGPQSVGRIGLYGQTVQDGKSGYWRLFFMQMQEEADRKAEKKPVESVAKETEEVVVGAAIEAKKKTRKNVVFAPPEIEEIPPFRPLPEFERVAEIDNVIVDSWRITLSIREMLAGFNETKVSFLNQLRESDDEDDLELLLLVA